MITEFLENSGVPESISGIVSSAIIFFVVIIISYLIGRTLFLSIFKKTLKSREVSEHARKPLIKLFKFVIVFASLTIAFGVAGFGSFLTAIATVSAAGTLAIGFALKDVISNFVSGVFLFVDRPFKIGDWIEWDDRKGEVEDISLRVTRIRTFNNELLTVPNRKLANQTVKNPVDGDKLRMSIQFGIGYEDDIEEATEIIIEEAEIHEGILTNPEPSVRLVNLGDSDVVLQSRVWIDDPTRSDYVRVKGSYVKSVKERFDEEGIDMPYPHRELSGNIVRENES
jgi:small-conductance mechanosensitive channel